jgi:hypothetical protein
MEYQKILQHDPLAVAGASPRDNTDRFQLISCNTPYQQAIKAMTWEQNNSSNSSVGQEITDTYTVNLSMTQSGDFLSFAEAQLKGITSWTWTNSSQHSESVGKSESATVTIAPPSHEYKGPSLICIFNDRIYKTFAFELVSPKTQQLFATGTLVSNTGSPLADTEVTLVEQQNKVRHRTVTNSKGEFEFYGDIRGSATLEANGVEPVLIPAQSSASVTLRRQQQ